MLRSLALVALLLLAGHSQAFTSDEPERIVWPGLHVVSTRESYDGVEIVALGPVIILSEGELIIANSSVKLAPQVDVGVRTGSAYGDEFLFVSIEVLGSGRLEIRDSHVAPAPQPVGRWSMVAGIDSRVTLIDNTFEWLGIGEDERDQERLSTSLFDATRGMMLWTPNVTIRGNTFHHVADAVKLFNGGELSENLLIDIKGHGFRITDDRVHSLWPASTGTRSSKRI